MPISIEMKLSLPRIVAPVEPELSTASERLRPDRPAALSFLLRDPLGPHALSFSRPSIHLAMIAIGMGVSNVSPDSSPSLQRT